MIKSNELMIGDWVLADGVPAQILSLGSKGATITGGLDKACHYDNMQPIPITLEILEKNGFEEDIRTDAWGRPSTKARSWTDCKEFDESDIGYEYYISLRYYKDEWLLQISTNHRSAFNAIVAHVHELQHALRLCGIDKEVVI